MRNKKYYKALVLKVLALKSSKEKRFQNQIKIPQKLDFEKSLRKICRHIAARFAMFYTLEHYRLSH
jgi:hypothetical protein